VNRLRCEPSAGFNVLCIYICRIESGMYLVRARSVDDVNHTERTDLLLLFWVPVARAVFDDSST